MAGSFIGWQARPALAESRISRPAFRWGHEVSAAQADRSGMAPRAAAGEVGYANGLTQCTPGKATDVGVVGVDRARGALPPLTEDAVDHAIPGRPGP